jgi:hypothetical protein
MDVEAVPDRGWSRAFDEPIPLPDGGELRTLIDAGRYVDALPRSMHEREEWQMVMEVLLSAVEGREPVRLVHIALTLALLNDEGNRGGQKMAGTIDDTGWWRPFDEPIPLPGGRTLVTLKDAGNYITKAEAGTGG